MANDAWRDLLAKRLEEARAQDGIKAFLETATELLDIDPRGDKKFRSLMNGELCELVIMQLSRDYIRATGAKAQVYHSVILKDLCNIQGDFRTELDFVMVTPCFFLTSECKSYFGDIEVVDDCTFRHFGKDTDVYRQSVLHHKHLLRYAEQLALPEFKTKTLPVYANSFVFSKGNIIDNRTAASKSKLRVLSVSNLITYYKSIFSHYTTPIFDYERACKIFNRCASSKALQAQHKQFVGY